MSRACLRGLGAGLALGVLGLVGGGCERAPRHADFRVGMERQAIRERFGEPLRVREMHKSGSAVWGPIEEFWSQVPPGARIEIWSYRSRHAWTRGRDETPGTTELYFVDGATALAGLGFAPDGVVYETE